MGRRSDIKPLPSLARLHELLSYDEETGVLTFRSLPPTSRKNINFNNKCGGKIAGTINAGGYLVVGIDQKYYLAHRIIWKMKVGMEPPAVVDHEDTEKANNRWCNLREASHGSNIHNSRLRKDNVTGVKGVYWDASHKAWCAQIALHGKQIRLGRFSDFEDARQAITEARKRLHGEFARAA